MKRQIFEKVRQRPQAPSKGSLPKLPIQASIPPSSTMNDRRNHYFTSRLILWIALWLMVLLLGVKISIGGRIQSLGLLAAALHSIITCFSGLFGWLLTTSRDRPTGREIYGHGRRESFFALLAVVAVSISWLGLLFLCLRQLLGAWQQELPFSVRADIPLLQFLGAIVAVTLGLGLLNRIQSRLCHSPLLRFNANQLFKDAGLMALAIAGLVGVWGGEPLIDLLVAAILLILVVEGFWRVLAWHFPLLIEQTAISPEILERAIAGVEGVDRCYNIRSRGIVGRFVYISLHLVLASDCSTPAPKVARNIEQILRDRYGPVQLTCTIDNDQ
ncbi:MAG: cation transporter [Cyanobacteriota bacterium]|nr:cation transporter [Cyanobacteriota bacterium]